MIEAIIFDMDGVISDTQKYHAKVLSELMLEYDIKISPEEITAKFSGVRAKEFFKIMFKDKNYDLKELTEKKDQRLEQLISLSIDAIPGAVELIKKLYKNNFKLAVVSGSNIRFVNSVLNNLKINKYFLTVVGGDQISKSKPDPEGFLLAANNLKVTPTKCVVIEDGISGMQAAKNANMKCIGLVFNKENNYPTENTVTSLYEVSLDYINKLK